MSPPYKLLDEATGEVATGPGGERWEGMDIPAGNKMELYDTSATGGAPWQRVSPSEIVRPPDGGEPPPIIEPPPINPLPPTGEGMDYPTNEQQLRDCLLGYAASTYVGMLDPRTNVEISSPIVIAAPGSGVPWGVNGNYAKITYRGSGDDLLRIEGTQGVNNRGLTLRNLVLDGGDGGNMSGGGAAACIRVSAPLGDNGPIYRFGIMDVFTSGSVNGLILEGGVYEGELRGLYCENHTGDGIILRHLPASDVAKGPIVSNVLMWHINSSRNYGAGLRTVYSVYLFGGSFILNGGGGVVAPDGIRGAWGTNGENTGGENQCVFDVPSNGYGSVIEGGEASSDGATRCRKWNGTAWEDVGKPLLYYINMGAGVTESFNHVSYYGAGSNPMRREVINGEAHEEKGGELAPVFTKLAPTNPEAIAKVEQFCDELLKLPQIPFVTEHMLHGGIYTRTIRLPAYTAIVAVLIKVPTSLVFAGEADIYTNGDLVRVNGYSVLPGSAMRKVAAVTYSDFAVSMMFATDAKTVEDAEKEFTDEYDLLVPLSEQDRHEILITGE